MRFTVVVDDVSYQIEAERECPDGPLVATAAALPGLLVEGADVESLRARLAVVVPRIEAARRQFAASVRAAVMGGVGENIGERVEAMLEARGIELCYEAGDPDRIMMGIIFLVETGTFTELEGWRITQQYWNDIHPDGE
jgi:hypothetical protein